ESVADPLGVEAGGEVPGLGLLAIRTEMREDKTIRSSQARWTASSGPLAALRGSEVAGYEIHHGQTELRSGAEAVLEIGGEAAGSGDGAVWGCYLHGVFGNDELRRAWLASLRSGTRAELRWEEHLDRELGRLADAVEASLDMRT